jgi:hypothetical protein
MREMMSTGFFDWAVTHAEATQVLQMLERMPSVERLVVVQELSNTNAAQTLRNEAPDTAKRMSPSAWLTVVTINGDVTTLKELIRQIPTYIDGGRDQSLMQRAMNLLTPNDIRQQAQGINSSQQAQAPLSRWLAVTPDPPAFELQRQFSEAVGQSAADDASQRASESEHAQRDASTNRAMLDPAFRQTIQTLEGLLSYGVFDWAITDAEARQVFGVMSRLPSEQVPLAVNQLDRGPFMDRFLGNLPASERWGANRRTFLRIISVRSAIAISTMCRSCCRPAFSTGP